MPTSLPHIAVIALGSNLDRPQEQIKAALEAISRHPQIELNRVSSLYITAPVGYADQPDFVNAVCIVQTALDGRELLAVLNRIEDDFGRRRSFRNAPRTLDLDIIDYNGETSSDPHLTLPHPRAHERSFVMCPLAEIAPDLIFPDGEPLASCLKRVPENGMALWHQPKPKS